MQNISTNSRPKISIDTFEQASKRFPNATLQYIGPFIARLNDEDIDAIQDILDKSDEDDVDEVVLVNQGENVPWPRKSNRLM